MTIQAQIKALRLHLLGISKLSYRAVDYAIKGYRLGSPEFSRYVRRGDSQLAEFHRRITDLCEKLLNEESLAGNEVLDDASVSSDKRFPKVAVQICGALQAVCTATAEIAHHTMLLLEDSCIPGSEALKEVCYLVNRLMCLCILAIFKKDTEYAEAVLQSDVEPHFEQAFRNLRLDVRRRTAIPAALEVAITNSLRQIAQQAHEIAEAVLFWIEGKTFPIEEGVVAGL
jgi:phosphate uptake regulator